MEPLQPELAIQPSIQMELVQFRSTILFMTLMALRLRGLVTLLLNLTTPLAKQSVYLLSAIKVEVEQEADR